MDKYKKKVKRINEPKVPERIDLGKFMEKSFAKNKLAMTKYTLISKITHKGENLEDGEFQAWIKKEGKWLECEKMNPGPIDNLKMKKTTCVAVYKLI